MLKDGRKCAGLLLFGAMLVSLALAQFEILRGLLSNKKTEWDPFKWTTMN